MSFKTLIARIFDYMLQKEATFQTSPLYYTRTEFDSNTTLFEEMSNCNLIGLKTNLNESDARVLLNIMQMTVDNNLWMFQKLSDVVSIYNDDNDFNLSTEDLSDYQNMDLWIQVLSKLGGQIESSYTLPDKDLRHMLVRLDGTFAHRFLSTYEQIYFEVKDLLLRFL